MNSRRITPRAFTLVEVLVTLALVAAIVPVAMQGISLASSARGFARRQMEAVTLAESKLNEIVVTGQWSSASLSGDFGPDWEGYRWTAESVTRDISLMEVSVRVYWTSAMAERSVSVSTLVYTEGGTEGMMVQQ